MENKVFEPYEGYDIKVKQEPYVDDTGIWVPVHPYLSKGQSSSYQMVLSKELFVEAYNKYIKDKM